MSATDPYAVGPPISRRSRLALVSLVDRVTRSLRQPLICFLNFLRGADHHLSHLGMRLGKEEVAVRQLDTAIRLLFDGGDDVSVHTLACAAANVLRNILKAQGGETWQNAIIESHPGMEREVRQTLVRAQNFFKHADWDPQAELDFDENTFDENTNDETIIVATLEYGQLLRLGAPSGRAKITTPMSVFQLWYLAKDPKVLLAAPNGVQIVGAANRLFPGLENISRVEQLARGAEVLRRREAAVSGRG